MRVFPARWRCWCAVFLIFAGACGILFSPSIGAFGSKELRSFTLNELREHDWGTAIVTSQFELPFVQKQRGLWFMNVSLAGSLGAIFGGVHWIAVLRRQREEQAV